MIRPATAEELPDVLDLWGKAGLPAGSTDDLDALIGLFGTDPGALLVAELDGEVIGALIAAWDGWRGGMYRLAVHPQRRRRGVGRALVQAGEARLRQLGARRIVAALQALDGEAVAFWVAVGYAPEPGQARFVRMV